MAAMSAIVSGVKLAVLSWGGEDLPGTAVLVHGITSNARSWARVAEALVGRGYRVLAPDLRGHGRTGPGDRAYGFRDLEADLAESLPCEPDVLIGHSLGGILSLLAVTDGLLKPRRLVLEDPAIVLPSKDSAERYVASSRTQPTTSEAILAANPSWRVEDAEAKAEALAALDWDDMRLLMEGNAPWDGRSRLADLVGLRIPTLLILAGPSDLVPPAEARRAEAILGPGSTVVVNGAGHSVHRDALPRFLAALFAWLDRPAPLPASASA
ncbi:MAG: alpha/beta hydrolase [Chloroflexi bacterium]|nr:alpha/beta hydrolase [Chloroflexota bacterium]